MGNTTIEWTNKVWNPVRGCSRVSEGCRNCYAEKVAARFSDEGQPFHLFADRDKSGSKWTGKVELVKSRLDAPLHWAKPRRIFVNSMSDLFHESLRAGQIDKVFAVMSQCPQHIFQILTKRPERMLEYITASAYVGVTDWAVDGIDEAAGNFGWFWPLPNVWLGVSVENQAMADARIPLLLRTRATKRFISYEPALGPVDLGMWLYRRSSNSVTGGGLDWVICGGESGPDARPMRPDWARSIVAQCKAAGVACFVKQMGAHIVGDPDEFPSAIHDSGDGHLTFHLCDRKGGDWLEWPEDLRVREFPS